MCQTEKFVKRTKSNIWMEPIIHTNSTFIKPDLVVESEKEVLIMDVSVVVAPRMEETWRIKR